MTLTSAQQRAVESIDKNVLVAAGAGSGKTRVLVERFVEILRRRPELKVSNIMAVTYTRKAAAEMRTRLKERLRNLAEESEGAEQERWMECLFAVDSARIGTIHSLCESILRNFPAEAGVDPQFEILDDLKTAELLQSAIDQSFREIIDEQGSEHALLLNLSLSEIESILSKIIGSSIEFKDSISRLENCSLPEFANKIAAQLKHVQSQIIADIIDHDDWQMAAEYLRNNSLADPKNNLEPVRKEIIALVNEVETAASSDLNHQQIAQCWLRLSTLVSMSSRSGGNSPEAKSLRANIKVLKELCKDNVDDLPMDVSESDCFDWQLLTALIALSRRALTIYESKKQEEHTLDYNDLILQTFSTLKQPDSSVRDYYHNVLSEILIDEFQDTNRTQASLLAYLAGPRTRLFLIGDDKQSIYKFQGADVSIFNDWHEYFRISADEKLYEDISIHGERMVLSLGHSFRSHPDLVNFVNSIFKQLLGEEDVRVPYRARFRELIAGRSLDEPGNGDSESKALGDRDAGDELNFDPKGHVNADPAVASSGGVEVIAFNASKHGERVPTAVSRDIEAKLVADWIVEKASSKSLVTGSDGKLRPIEYGDFGILVQRNGDCALLEPALAERGIPYVAYTGKGFLNRQEIYDIENLLAFLADPYNDHALLAILRSPICSLTDDLIHNLLADKREKLWHLLQHEAARNRSGYHAVSRAVGLLRRLLTDLFTKTLAELIDGVIRASNYDLILMALPNGKQRSRNLWKLVTLASAKEQMSCREFVDYLRAMRHFDVKQSDAPVDTSNSVKLMTIHAAKGLEFPAVVLPILQVKANGKARKVLFHRHYGFALNTARSKDDVKPLWYRLALRLDKDMELAEKKRLLYVAMTRARDHLAFFIDEQQSASESFAGWLTPLFRLDQLDEVNDGGGHAHMLRSSQSRGRNLRIRNSTAGFLLMKYDASNLSSFVHTDEEEDIDMRGDVTEFDADAISETNFHPENVQSFAPDYQAASAAPRAPYRTDLLEPILSKAAALPVVRDSWIRVTPKSEEIEVDARMLGTLFHALMEFLSERRIMPDEGELLAIANLQGEMAAHPAMTRRLVQEAKLLLQRFIGSDLHKSILSAKQILHELPYYKVSDTKSTTSRPDLLIETNDSNWLIVDYKTDRFPADAMAAQAKTHAKQLEQYRQDLSDIAGIQANKSIYFARHGVLYHFND